MNIVVLCGGVSSEREVSLWTSRKVSGALKSLGHQVLMIDVFFGTDTPLSFEDTQDYGQVMEELHQKSSTFTPEMVKATGLFGPNVLPLCREADIVFMGLHGENGEDGKIQAVFDRENIAYTGTGSESSALAMNKKKTKEIIGQRIRMPKGTALRKGETPHDLPGIPCVIKPNSGGSSLGVFIVKEESEFEKALSDCFAFDDTVLIEEYIEGRELTQGVLDGVALPPVEICPNEGEWYDFTRKYSSSTREVCPAQIPESVLSEMTDSTILFGKLLGLSVYYRIDYLLDRNGVLYALEANTLPGMTDTSLVPQEAAAVGIDYPQLCQKIIDLSLQK